MNCLGFFFAADDSDMSNDSGIDSGGSLPPDYMDIDEFLVATGVKIPSVKGFSTANVRQKYKTIPGNDALQHDQSNVAEGIIKKNSQSKNKEQKTELTEKTVQKPSSEDQISKEDEDSYEYKYNPLPMKKKAKRQFINDGEKDDKYWKRRKRNNEAARRSRDMRRQREIEISKMWKDLERENERLKDELQKLKDKANDLEKQLMEKQK